MYLIASSSWDGRPYDKRGAPGSTAPGTHAARKLDDGQIVGQARMAGATPLWEWIGEGATVFSY